MRATVSALYTVVPCWRVLRFYCHLIVVFNLLCEQINGDISGILSSPQNNKATLDGKYSERVQLPAKAKFGGFVANTWQHLSHLLLEV